MLDRKAKYIIWDNGLNECVMIFSNHIMHANVALALNITPISAGFVEFTSNGDMINVIVSGDSVSLRCKSRPEDANIIANELKLSFGRANPL